MRPIRSFLFAVAAFAAIASLPSCGADDWGIKGTVADNATPRTSALTAGQFCTQPVDGQCLSPGYPVALTSTTCDAGNGPQHFTIFGALQVLNPSGDHATYTFRHLPKNGSVGSDNIYLDCATLPAQQHGTGLPYYDQATFNLGTLLRGQGSLGCTLTRYVAGVSHTTSIDAFLNTDIYASTGGTNRGRINAQISTVNGATFPAAGICFSSYWIQFSF